MKLSFQHGTGWRWALWMGAWDEFLYFLFVVVAPPLLRV
jgi:hypothetical protein